MQNLLLGTSGSGKSYEACVYHILPAVTAGRKVITNLPLNIEAWKSIDPEFEKLIEFRKKPQPVRGTWEPTREDGAFNVRPQQFWQERPRMDRVFSSPWDFYDDWRHPVNGTGALFVIDEAQNVIPYKKTNPEVEEWTALHRHWFNDVIWITQSYGKLSRAIIDNLQMVYRFRKKVAWGQPDRYIRKVQDGVRGEVLNTSERSYDKKYFCLYRSNTQVQGDGKEQMAEDIVPIWKHWSFKGAALCAIVFVGFLFSGYLKNPMSADSYKHQQQAQKPQPKPLPIAQQSKPQTQPPMQPKQEDQKPDKTRTDPFGSFGVHFVGVTDSKRGKQLFFTLSQNGQLLRNLTQKELTDAGYQVSYVSTCLAKLSYQNTERFAYCDSPQVGVVAAGQQLDRQEQTQKVSG